MARPHGAPGLLLVPLARLRALPGPTGAPPGFARAHWRAPRALPEGGRCGGWAALAALVTTVLAGLAALPARAAADEKLLAAARAAQPAVIESLREMVAIESGTMDAPGLARLADMPSAASPRWA